MYRATDYEKDVTVEASPLSSWRGASRPRLGHTDDLDPNGLADRHTDDDDAYDLALHLS
jgi:hypothetical protein